MAFLLICTIILIVCAVKYIFRDKVLYDFAGKIPGPKAYAVIGSSHKFLKKNEQERFDIMKNMTDKYQNNPLMRFWMGPTLFIFVNDPKLIEQVLNSPKCIDKSFIYKFLRLDKGLLAANHSSWEIHRKILENSFTKDMIRSFVPTFVSCADKMIKSLEKAEDKDKIEILKFVSRCSLTAILATSFGLSATEVEFSDDILKAVEELIKIISHRCHEPILYAEPVYRVTPSYYREKKYRKRCYNYLDQVLKERRELITPTDNNNSSEPSTSRVKRDEETGDVVSEQKNFIDQMILRDEFSDDEIHDHIYTFIAAGYETIALQTSYTLLLLAIYSDIQEKVIQEIVEHFPNDNSKLDKDSIEKLRYLDMVLKESLRLLPAVPLVGRKTLEEFELNELVVPSGVTFLINFFSLHRKKDFWGPDADEFNPERFSKEQESQREPHNFLPFSSGPRNCIGKHYATLAMKIFLVKFLRNYKVSTDLKYEELRLKADITLKICNDIILKIENR